jgi:serine/threonine-protein kinase
MEHGPDVAAAGAEPVDGIGEDVERQRWRQVEAVFQAAQERAPAEQAAFLDQACSGDPTLRQEVESLLRAATDTRFLEPPSPIPADQPTAPSARSSSELLERLQLGLGSTYLVERELAGGSMARIFVATDTTLDRRVVLKVLAPELAAGLNAERFHREVRLAASLQHPHIVPLHAAGQAEGLLYYTMPFVAGESLRHRLDREGPLPTGEVVRLLREVSDALGFAHRRGIMHRDLKPSNILLEEGHALVADFGIAKALVASTSTTTTTTDPTLAPSLTSTGLVVGTPAYMAPEQAASDHADHRADLYALGCLGYELLTGRPPFHATSVRGLLMAHLTEPPTEVTVHRPDVPPRLASLVMGLLAKDPERRPQTAIEVLKALETAEQPGAVEQPGAAGIRPSGFGARLMATARYVVGSAAHRRGAIVVGAATLALIVGALVMARRGGSVPADPAGGPRMLAVLPFQNLGLPADQYFADGLTEEITSRLALMGDLGVISRTSAERYRGTNKSLKQVGRELGVGYVLEGSIRWDRRPDGTNRVRVTPQLIRVADDRNVWANRYDAELRDIFEIQANIAEQVATALGLVVAAPGPGPAEKPTTNLSAYDAYLRGNTEFPEDFYGSRGQILERLKRAADSYREAVRFDSTFALAYAKLGSVALLLSKADEAKAAIDRALQLDPNLAEAHYARGMYRLDVESDTTEGFRELETAVRQRPNDAELLMELANTEWTIRGPKSQAITRAERAVQLDPRNQRRVVVLAYLYQEAQRFDEAERTYDRAIALRPENPGPYTQKAVNYLIGYGDIARARQVLRQAAAHVDTMELISAAATTLMPQHSLGVLDEGYQQTVLRLPLSTFAGDTVWYAVAKGAVYRAHGDSVRFRAYFDTAFAVLQARNKKSQQPDYFMMSFLLAARGQREQAYAAFAKARAGRRWIYDEFEARVAVIAGDYERAIHILERKNWGTELTVPWLRTDPFWDPLRSDPRFQRLIYSTAKD